MADGRFTAEAGRDAEGWVYPSAYTDPSADPACAEFAAAYRRLYDTTQIPPQAAEAYDAVRFLAAGLTALGPRATADRDGRNALRLRLRTLTHQGITRTIAIDGRTRLFDVRNGTGLFLYRIEDGGTRFLGPYRDAEPSWQPAA